jgi:hypothetical protein
MMSKHKGMMGVTGTPRTMGNKAARVGSEGEGKEMVT